MKDIEKLDAYLLKTLNYLFKNWYKKEVGIVACCLKDGEKTAFATSAKNGINWLHAERNAYNKFRYLHGKPSKDAVFIITLSPCVKGLKYRGESSCADLAKSLGINRIHFGALDTHHVPTLDGYTSLGFTASITKNPKIAEMCQNLMGMFSTYDARINSELLAIKESLGDSFFEPVFPVEAKKLAKPHKAEVLRCRL
jgi:pyrimidine deaminase RibD-like protein